MDPVSEDAKTVAKIHPRPRSVHLGHTPPRIAAIQICPRTTRMCVLLAHAHSLRSPETAVSVGCTRAHTRFFARLVQVARGTGRGLHFRADLRETRYRSRQFAALHVRGANTDGRCLGTYFHYRTRGVAAVTRMFTHLNKQAQSRQPNQPLLRELTAVVTSPRPKAREPFIP